MTFREWLIAQKDRRNDIVGDVARDVAMDEHAPEGYRALRDHIANVPNHHPDILACLDEAWEQYKNRAARSS